jgi:hypothetical protein
MTFNSFPLPRFFKSTAVALLLLCTVNGFSQDIKTLSAAATKGDYAILEVRMNNEDEFRTIEGHTAGLSRVALFTGKNTDKEIISKDFSGFNQVIVFLNELKALKWKVVDVYPIKGQSLIITHYLLQKTK